MVRRKLTLAVDMWLLHVGFNNRRMEGQIGVHHSVIDRIT